MLKIFKIFFGFLLISINVHFIYGDVEMCTSGGTQVFTFRAKHCPGGVLFSEPVDFMCMQASTGTDKTDWREDACSDAAYSDTSTKVQLMTNLDDEIIMDDDSCSGTGANKCDVPKMIVSELVMKPKMKDSAEEYVQTPEEALKSNDTAVVDQTERMLKYLHGLLEDPDEDGPVLRVVQLLTLSFQITHGYCTEPWLTKDFREEILKAFLFILRESDTNRIKDVSLREYEAISAALTTCFEETKGGNPDMALELTGTECLTAPKVKTVRGGQNTRIKFQRTSKSFQLNKYDVVVDATWSMIDFVHGMCFNKFSPFFNSHHLYQQAMERLFTDEIVYRWARPTVLNTNDAWDSVFLANVRTNIRNIEACIQGAYQGKPYLHRLERILDMQHRRRKRSLTNANDLDGAGWCFKDDSERMAALKELCPDATTDAPVVAP